MQFSGNATLALAVIPLTLRRFFADFAIGPCPILAAVSGGIDSTALLLALSDLRNDGFAIRAAHVHHHLRGDESDADEAFVRELCARLDIALDVADGTLDEDAVRTRGIEAAAREIRYRRLEEIRVCAEIHYVATAHQKNDQAETVLMRLLTGSGIAGLRGIHPVREDGFIRPLLDVTRAEIEAYLTEKGVTARVDSSNDNARFLRNRVRLLVRELGAVDNLARVAEEAREQWPRVEKAIDEAESSHLDVGEQETRFRSLPTERWLRAALLRRHIRRLDPHARDFDAHRIAEGVESIRRISVTKNLELVRKGTELVLRRPAAPTPTFELELTEGSSVWIPAIGKRMTVSRSRAPELRQRFALPSDGPARFAVRNRRAGDRFQPLGLAGSKKLKDFLIDRKVPLELRDQIPLLLWNDEIVWVAGVEISERFKITESSTTIYEVWVEEA